MISKSPKSGGGVKTIGNPRSKKPRTPIKSSSLLLGVLGCVFVGTTLIFGTSMHYISQSTSQTIDERIDPHHFPPHHTKKLEKARLLADSDEKSNSQPQLQASPSQVSLTHATQVLQATKDQFYERYGGQTAAEELQKRAITAFGNLQDTADRILRAIAQQTDFVMGFAGYSITVGRGNFFNQSFPFVVERVLREPLQALGISQFVVRNSAIGGIPSFPYAYCLDHFVSRQSDILSWDFSMNEKSKDPAVFEAYIRQALHQLPKQPMVIMVDNNPSRRELLQKYVNQGLLKGALTVAKADSVIDPALLAKPDAEKPRGLQQWEVFGAPDKCPGKGSWHPKKAEHEFMGWMIAMHFVQALDLVLQTMQAQQSTWIQTYKREIPQARAVFPDPLSKAPPNDASVTEILFGTKVTDGKYQMKQLSCRTNFLPATDHEKVLDTLVASGMNTEATADNIMDTRSDDYYQKGWVLDVSQVERDTKRKVEKCGGLGYIDMKIALYGIPESGTLELFLPYEGEPHSHDHDEAAQKDAQHWFDGVLICEANDKRPKEACQLDRDLDFVVGGVPVPAGNIAMINGAGEYLQRKTCVNVGVPPDAQTSNKNKNNKLGLQIQITAKGAVTRKAGACCISHVVWEQH